MLFSSENEIKIYSETKASFLDDVIKPLLPHAEYGINHELSTRTLLKGSDYEYDGDYKFVHFTSLQNLINILRSGFLRMSEFRNLQDKNEVNFAYEIFKDFDIQLLEKIDKLKEELFCLSMSKYSDEIIRDQYLWKTYGCNSKGCCIVFSIIKEEYSSYCLGNIIYGNEKLKPLEELKKRLVNFAKKGSFGGELDALISLVCFHKEKKYIAEKEVRFLFYLHKQRGKKHDWLTIYEDINSNNEVRYFNKLYFEQRHPYIHNDKGICKESINKMAPILKINEIIIGNGNSDRQAIELSKFIRRIYQENFNSTIDVSKINNNLDKLLFNYNYY